MPEDCIIWKKTMNKKITWSIIGLLLIVLGYVYATPYLVLNKMKNAAQAGDSAKLSEYIDYSSVRQNLKDQINSHMLQELGIDEQSRLANLGQKLASTLLDKMVDSMVTPEGMTMVLQGRGLKEVYQAKVTQETAEVKQQHKPQYKAGYTSWQNFEVQIQAPEYSKVVKINMVRDGLSWKVNKVGIPLQ
jgi:hypothetical protein